MPGFIWTAGIPLNFVNPLHLCMVSLLSTSLLKSSESEWITEFKRLNMLYQQNVYTCFLCVTNNGLYPFNKRNAKCTEIPFTGHATTLAPSENLKKCFFLAQWKFTIHVVSAEALDLDLKSDLHSHFVSYRSLIDYNLHLWLNYLLILINLLKEILMAVIMCSVIKLHFW